MVYQEPKGRLKGKRRPFTQVVRDLRYVVHSVIRHRRIGEDIRAVAIGSGFFVSPTIFVTCHHVVNSKTDPHQDGDTYQLVCNLTGSSGSFHLIRNSEVGKTVHLYPECDLGLLVATEMKGQPYAALEYGDAPEGKEIGVAGYPLPKLVLERGELQYSGLIFRIAKGVITASYSPNISGDETEMMASVPVIEVNFLFVPGNSGGPIFDSENGRVLGFVHGYRTDKIREQVQEATLIQELPEGMDRKYIENLNALYSLGIKLSRVRAYLENFGVSL